MAINTYVGSEIDPQTSSFETWLTKTNSIITDMGSVVITTGNNNIGNTSITGTFSANTIVANNITISANSLVQGTARFTKDIILPAGTSLDRPTATSSGSIRFNTELSSFEGYDGSNWGDLGGGGLGSPIFISANYLAAADEYLVANTTAGGFTVTLPIAPAPGVVIKIGGTNWETNNLTIARNGSTIEGAALDLVLDIDNASIELIYDGTTWRVFANIGPTGFTGSQGTFASLNDDVATNATRFVTFANQTSGTANTVFVSSTKLTYNPFSGTLNAVDFNSTSDIKHKENIVTITAAMDKIKKIRGVNFTWKETHSPAMGLIAQELEQVIPEVVNQTENGKSVNYGSLVGLLIEAIKEQQNEIDALKTKII